MQQVWRSEWVRVIAEKDAEIANLKALAAGVTHHAECWRQSQESAKAEREIRCLRETLTLAEHKIDQYLQGQYPDGVSLRSTAAAIRAALEEHAVLTAEQEIQRLRKALETIQALDFAKIEGKDDFYSGPSRFVRAWNIAHEALNPPQQKDGE